MAFIPGMGGRTAAWVKTCQILIAIVRDKKKNFDSFF